MRKIKDLMSLQGKTALITGGAGHLGSTIAETFAEQGCNLAIMDKNAAECERVALYISERYDVKALAYPCDLESNEDLSALPVQVFDSLGSGHFGPCWCFSKRCRRCALVSQAKRSKL